MSTMRLIDDRGDYDYDDGNYDDNDTEWCITIDINVLMIPTTMIIIIIM